MSKTWAKFRDEVMPEIPGASAAMVDYAIRKAAIAFCERSRAYRIDHTPIDAVAGTAAYSWNPGTNLVVVRPEIAWYDGKQLEAKGSKELDGLYEKWPLETGTPLYYLSERADQLILVPYPSANLTGGITAKVSVTPANDATDIIDWIWQEYVEEIGTGAKALLMHMDKKPWSNQAKAEEYEERFSIAIGKAMRRAEVGYGRATVKATNPRRRFM